MTNPFFTFLATAKTKSNPVYTSCHACLTYYEICQQSNPIRSAWCYIYIYSIHFLQMTFDTFGSSYCILWLLAFFDPLMVLCRMMSQVKINSLTCIFSFRYYFALYPRMIQVFTVLRDICSASLSCVFYFKCFSNHTSEVYADLKTTERTLLPSLCLRTF